MNPETPTTVPESPPAEAEQPILITADMLVPVRPKDSRVPFEKGMSYFPILIILLIAANVAVYLWEIATGALVSSESVIAAGALYRDKVLAGEWWRLLSAAFLHGGFDHILGNTIFMYILGLATEHAFGLAKTAVIYTLAALTGSLLSLAMSPGPGVGASGAIFGLMGALTVVFFRRRADFYLRDRGIGIFVGAVAVYQIGVGFFEPFIDNWAHLGGFLGGAAATLVLRPSLGEESRTFSAPVKALTAAGFVLVAGLYLFGAGYLAAVEAQAWLHFGNKTAALSAADRAIAKNPANAHVYYLRGSILLDAKQYDAAIADLNRYLEGNRNSHRAMFTVGHAYYEREQFPRAIDYYSQALALAPGDVHYLNSRGYTYILTGQYAAARADFAALLKIDAQYAPAYGNLGLIHAYQGEFPPAVELLAKAHGMDSSQEALNDLISGLKFELQAKRAEAVKSYTAFIGVANKERLGWLAEIRFAENRVRILRSLQK